ncbi:MAG: ion channel [Planctomycetota bacterium]
MRKFSTRGPFSALFVALLIFLPLAILVEESKIGETILTVGFTGILLAGLYVAQLSRPMLLVAIGLFTLNLVMRWLDVASFVNWHSSPTLRGSLSAAYFVYLVVVLARILVFQRVVNVETVVGGINVYLLMGFTFAQIHWIIESVAPGSYDLGGLFVAGHDASGEMPPFGAFLYYSFVTMTTLGYGDVSPVTPAAQLVSVAEAVTGQLYVAILIGGLVGMWISERMHELELEELKKDRSLD